MKKFTLSIILIIISAILLVNFHSVRTSEEKKEIKRLAHENYKLRNELLRLSLDNEDSCDLIGRLEEEIDIMERDLIHMTELEDFEHYKMIKSHMLNPLASNCKGEHSKNKTDAVKELMTMLDGIVDYNSFDTFVTKLAKEELIVIDHLTGSFEKIIVEENRRDEFIEYILEFRVRVTTEESYVLSRLKYMLMT